jgi:hypothetical protein
MNSKLALIATVIIAVSIGAGAYVFSLSSPSRHGVQDYAVDNPSPSSNTLTNTTINAVNSTIIAGENTTIINPNPTVTATPQPTVTPTPKPYDFKVTYRQVERNTTTITVQVTFSNGHGQVVTVNNSEILLGIIENGASLGRATKQVYAKETTITVNREPYTTNFVFELDDFALSKELNLANIYTYELAIGLIVYAEI